MKKMKFAIIMFLVISVFTFYIPENKQVLAQAEGSKKVSLGGESFGIRMFSDGVLVIGVEDTLFSNNVVSPALLAGIKPNDVIKSADGVILNTNEELSMIIENSGEKEISLKIDRNGKEIDTVLIPKADSQGNYKAGMWVKDSAAGIGTVTYYDNETSSFGALGHGICESETGKLIPIGYGEIANAKISGVDKSNNGDVGSLNGYFDGEIIGKATVNSENGVFGVIEKDSKTQLIDVADKKEVKVGNAKIYCTVDNGEKRSYNIKVKRLKVSGEDTMLIEITDPELLEITGGIVQGMSGAPIVQNEKLIGAVTHVLVNNVKCGYGIYIEDMLESA
ncbi:MAG: hypothetical protein IJ341_03005 [Bacteroidales bacterium]|nr:hypothetical protein [Bacteroidales bacterium]